MNMASRIFKWRTPYADDKMLWRDDSVAVQCACTGDEFFMVSPLKAVIAPFQLVTYFASGRHIYFALTVTLALGGGLRIWGALGAIFMTVVWDPVYLLLPRRPIEKCSLSGSEMRSY